MLALLHLQCTVRDIKSIRLSIGIHLSIHLGFYLSATLAPYLSVYLCTYIYIYIHPSTIEQTFVEKTFTDGSQTAKIVNVFSLESFPPYDTTSTSPLHATGNSPEDLAVNLPLDNRHNMSRKYSWV